MRKTIQMLGLLTAVILLAAACANQPSDSDAPDAGEAAALAYAECMREHGVDFPDPIRVDGGFDIRPPEGIDPDSPAYQFAQVECEGLRQARIPEEDLSPEDRAFLEEEMERMLDFAACMRDQGIDFPDPVLADDGISGPAGPLDDNQEGFEQASAVCEEEAS